MDLELYLLGVLKHIKKSRLTKFNKVFLEVHSKLYKEKIKNEDLKDLKILILNTACNGFGDIIFSMKVYTILKEWYPEAIIKIASTKVDLFKQLGADNDDLIKLKGVGNDQCIKFEKMYFVDDNNKILINTPNFDLIFVSPLTIDFEIEYEDVKKLISYSNKYNTFFFSEYNDRLDKGFDFNMGIGEDRLGMLFVDKGKTSRLSELKNNYVVIYIAESVDDSINCFLSFIKMISEKYHKFFLKFDIVIPPWIGKYLEEKKIILDKNILKYYPNINLIDKDKTINLYKEANSTKILNFRADILPLSYDKMKSLFSYAERDILVTGDQSITDVLACCWKEKLPFYQIVPWKIDFAYELSVNLPQIFLEDSLTSCGDKRALTYNPNFSKFMKDWDFKKNGKDLMDAIIRFYIFYTKNVNLKELINSTLDENDKNKLMKIIEEFISLLNSKNSILEKNYCNNKPITNLKKYIDEIDNVLIIIKNNGNFLVDCINRIDLNCDNKIKLSFGEININCKDIQTIIKSKNQIFYLTEENNKYNITICDSIKCLIQIFK